MKLKLFVCLLSIPLLLLACTSKKHSRRDFEEVFVTNIKHEGSKRFSYSLTTDSPKQNSKKGSGGKGRNDKGSGGGQRGKKRDEGGNNRTRQGGGQNDRENRTKQKALDRLEFKLAESGYCRDGYFEIDTYISRGHTQIMGECNDTATDDDRRIFPNQQF